MSQYLKKTIGFLSIIPAVILFTSLAKAYVLQGQHILELMTERLGQAKTLSISQKVIIYKVREHGDPLEVKQEEDGTENDIRSPMYAPSDEGTVAEGDDLSAVTIELEETLKYIFSQAFRSDIITDDNQRIHVFANGEALTVIDGTVKTPSETRFDLYKDLLLYRLRPELVGRLSQLNVDVSVSSLGRFEGRVAFVIGAQYPDESVTQIWVDKETFRPIRLLITDAENEYSSNLDVRYLNWWQLDEIWYPMRIEFFEDDTLVRVITVQKYAINQALSGDLFNIEQLKSLYPKAISVLSDAGESESPSEVQETIEEFRKIFE